MANALAIASVTASLRAMVDYALNGNEKLTSALGEKVTVTAVSPKRAAEMVGVARLNLYLFQVAPTNSARTAAMAFQAAGVQSRPPLALDLQYLVSAYGDDPYIPEMMLGYVMEALHETPVLSRDLMRNVLALPVGEDTPAIIRNFTFSALTDRTEQLKVSPLILSLEELAQLWAGIGSNRAPSIAYTVSAVLV